MFVYSQIYMLRACKIWSIYMYIYIYIYYIYIYMRSRTHAYIYMYIYIYYTLHAGDASITQDSGPHFYTSKSNDPVQRMAAIKQ